MSQIVIVAAIAENFAIGKNNSLLWNIPLDMARFRKITAGKTVVMGSRTWESLPDRFRPLPGRRNVVISSMADYSAPGAEVVSSPLEALDLLSGTPEIFVIGGGMIYREFLPMADRLEISRVIGSPEADTFFPAFGAPEWDLFFSEPHEDDGVVFETWIKTTVKSFS